MRLRIEAFGLIILLTPGVAHATPSTTYWAPSTASCQPWKVPHITYDTYFGKGAPSGQQGAPIYPVDIGLTTGFLPSEKLQGEVGFDLLLPTQDPYLLNGKLCTPESAWFNGSPALGFGVYDVGFSKNITDFDVIYAVLQKTIPGIGGYVVVGVYHGMNQTLFTNSNGNIVQTGLLAAVAAPEINIGLTGLKKIVLVADAQTGKNVLGAWGVGSYFYFTDSIDILTGPVFFLDKALQPGGRDMFWTVQLDVDVSLGSPQKRKLVELSGVEPPTSAVRLQRSTN